MSQIRDKRLAKYLLLANHTTPGTVLDLPIFTMNISILVYIATVYSWKMASDTITCKYQSICPLFDCIVTSTLRYLIFDVCLILNIAFQNSDLAQCELNCIYNCDIQRELSSLIWFLIKFVKVWFSNIANIWWDNLWLSIHWFVLTTRLNLFFRNSQKLKVVCQVISSNLKCYFNF